MQALENGYVIQNDLALSKQEIIGEIVMMLARIEQVLSEDNLSQKKQAINSLIY